jgi:purine nucleosidase
VTGNVPLALATRNALISVEQARTYAPPVYEGCPEPMVPATRIHAFGAHGQDGLGDVGYPDPMLRPEKEHAVDAILRLLRASPAGEYELVTLGPLTNIALCAVREPETVSKLRAITVMGGAFAEVGKYPVPVAEFNIKADVEAANVVLGAGVPVTFVPINACRGDTFTTPEEIEMLLASGSPVAKFTVECNRTLIALNEARFGVAAIDPADPVALAAATCPECVAAAEDCYVVFEQKGEYTRGFMVFDTKGHFKKPFNAKLVTRIDADKYKEYAYRLMI